MTLGGARDRTSNLPVTRQPALPPRMPPVGSPEGSYLLEALLAEGTLGRVVQAALQTALTEGVSAGGGDGLVEQPGDQGNAPRSCGCGNHTYR